MTFYLRKHKLSEFDPASQDLTGCVNGWNVYSWCTQAEITSSELLVRLRAMDSVDAGHLAKSMAKLIKVACMGKPLQDSFDEKQCHESFTFTRPSNGHEHKVYRLWLGGKVRVYFCYGNGKSMVVFYGLSKRKDKLSIGEEAELAKVCESFLVCQEQNKIIVVEKKIEG